MKNEPRELILVTQAQQMLAKASTIDDIKEIRNLAQLARVHAKMAGKAQDVIVRASSIKVQAERKLGLLLQTMPLAKGSPRKKTTVNQPPQKDSRSSDATGSPVYLRDIGVTKSESSRAQRIARLPQEEFDGYIDEQIAAGREPTTAGVLRLARDIEVAESLVSEQCNLPGVVDDLNILVKQGAKFRTIYSDPPWPYDNQITRASASNHYPTMTLEDIFSEPVAQLAAENCHLHLWTTTSFLPEALELLSIWGFIYKSHFIWTKSSIGLGNYWRVSHECVLLGVKGNLPFRDKAQRSWLEAKRTGHSSKPEEVKSIISKVSHPPFLEMYSRTTPLNSEWTAYGNQIKPDSQKK
jgi:N6-adenosine-specific RNA methylase IME4